MKNKRIKMEREGKTGKGADMKFSEMNIRDPYIMKSRGNYYLYPGNGGHGMVLETYDGRQGYLMYFPNEKFAERPVLHEVWEIGGTLELTVQAEP